LNAQAELMKDAVTGLLRLVGRVGAAGQVPKKTPVAKPVLASRQGVTKSNGHVAKTAGPTNGSARHPRSEIPLAGDFQNF
jgi:hypothetical protein